MPRKTKIAPVQYSMDDYFIKKADVRLKIEESPGLYSYNPITTPDKAVNVMAMEMSAYSSEVICVVNLDAKCHAINYNICSMGTINSSLANMREIYKSAILSNASSIIMLHNHPSGDVSPSMQDIDVTKKVIAVGELLEIPILDHIIIGGGNGIHFSFHDSLSHLWKDNAQLQYNLAAELKENAGSYNLQSTQKDSVPYKIYQLKEGSENHYIRFTPLSQWEELGKVPEISLYKEVYSGEAEKMEDRHLCEELYVKFNTEIPRGYHGHSLSVSDVIVLGEADRKRVYFCDAVGFKTIHGFERMMQKENPLKSAEEQEEQNYNMIDGIPNNGYGEKQEGRSIMEQLEEKKQIAASGKKKTAIGKEVDRRL